MADRQDRYYRPSGIFPLTGVAMMLGGGAVVAAVVSIIYALLIFYNPFIYINFVGAMFLGGAAGGAAMYAGKFGKVRNPTVYLFAGIALGVFATYLSWVWYIWVLTDYEAFLFSPAAILMLLQEIASDGMWSLSSWTPTGLALYAFWLVEAGIIIYFSAFLAVGLDTPFCEACGEWTKEEENVVVLENTENELLKQALEENHFEVLQQLPKADPSSSDSLHVNLHTCPRCSDSNYLAIRQVVVTQDEKGKDETETTDVVKNLHIPSSVVAELRSKDLPSDSPEAS